MKVSLIELFEETVRKYPQKVAVIDKDREIAFSDLRGKSLQLASALMALGIGQNRPVGVFLDKSIESVYADLGILYAGDFYMNLDIKTPAERIRNILQLVEPAAIISTTRQIKPIEGIIPSTMKVILLDEAGEGADVDAADSRRSSTLILHVSLTHQALQERQRAWCSIIRVSSILSTGLSTPSTSAMTS